MELRQIRHFVGIAEAGSLLKASARLHVAQPALGQQMAALERELGTRLFDRSSRGVTLTEAGRVFIEHARILLADAERARQAVRQQAEAPSGEVVVGLPTTVALALTVPLVAQCRAEHPLIRLQVVEAYSGWLREWLLAGRLDLALLFGDGPDASLAKRTLLDEQLALVTAGSAADATAAGSAVAGAGTRPRRSRAARPARAGIPLQALAGQPLVLPGRAHGLRRIIDEACEAQGLALQVVAEIDSLPSVKKAVEAGIGATVLPVAAVAEEVAAGRLRAATIDDAAMLRRVVCAHSVTRPLTAAASAVIGRVTALVAEMVRTGRWPAVWRGDGPG